MRILSYECERLLPCLSAVPAVRIVAKYSGLSFNLVNLMMDDLALRVKRTVNPRDYNFAENQMSTRCWFLCWESAFYISVLPAIHFEGIFFVLI